MALRFSHIGHSQSHNGNFLYYTNLSVSLVEAAISLHLAATTASIVKVVWTSTTPIGLNTFL